MNKYVKKINIGNIEINNNIFLAPMAGVTDIPFRKICREFNPGLTYTEMASSRAMEYNSQKTEKLLNIPEYERPSVVQIFGNSPEVISNTIERLNNNDSIDIIDINMGCPAPKLVKNGDGAGLLLDLKKVDQILKAAISVAKKPITVKTRKGFDNHKITAIEVAKMCEYNGISAITIHGRTREEYYSGHADIDIIKKVKESTSIPVIGNGDIVDLETANNMFEYTGCDGIMIARGAQGNPWIFKDIIEGEEYIPSKKEILDIILKHIDYQLEFEQGKVANLKLRKHIAWYLKGLDGNNKIKEMINTSNDIENTRKILINYLVN